LRGGAESEDEKQEESHSGIIGRAGGWGTV
jgi:hypothetical protein